MQCIIIFLVLGLISCLSVIQAAPIKTTFDGCKQGHAGGVVYNCCPLEPRRPIVNFIPLYNSSRPLRIRRALQCLDEEELSVYRWKMDKAYELMRALPDDDPRSLRQQYVIHCAYGTGSFDNGGDGIDIHFSWLFHPWHRWFLYFHERILQSLLGDPTFTLHFWNWDNDGTPVAGHKGCLKAGNTFPAMYADPSSPLFHPGRSLRAAVPSLILDLGISQSAACNFTRVDVDPENVALARNSQLLHDTMVTNSNTSSTFFGRPYRAGDKRVKTAYQGIGSLEENGHATVHFWIGGDMFTVPQAPKDPVFYAHHGNIERLWHVWHRLGPDRVDPEDSDFLDAEFLLYDENADLLRVKVKHVLDHRVLGYDYEETNDASWNYGSLASKSDNFLTAQLSESVLAFKAQAIQN